MKSEKKRTAAALILNSALFVLSAVGNLINAAENSTGMLQFYTVDSNILGMAASGVWAVFLARKLADPVHEPPLWAKTLKYVSVCCLSVTFAVVLCVLAPMHGLNGYVGMLFTGSMLYQHFLCPVLALVSFIFFDGGPALGRNAPLWALLPTLIYAAVTVTLNITGAIKGPYPFLMVLDQPVWASALWLALIPGSAYLLALLLKKAARPHI